MTTDDAATWADSGAYWSDSLEELHEESSRDHFLDVWNRRAILDRIGAPRDELRIIDVGCSTGYLLEDLRRARATARLAGADYLYAGLPVARSNVPSAGLFQADACALPLADSSADVIVSANLLEHVPDDAAALREFARVLVPGGCAVIVVPAAPGLYDYYDRYLHHQRRYGRGELAGRARAAGLEVREDLRLGSLFYPAFWLVKKRNRLMRGRLEGAALAAQVERDIARTTNSRLGSLLVDLERILIDHRIHIPVGVRELAVFERPRTAPASPR